MTILTSSTILFLFFCQVPRWHVSVTPKVGVGLSLLLWDSNATEPSVHCQYDCYYLMCWGCFRFWCMKQYIVLTGYLTDVYWWMMTTRNFFLQVSKRAKRWCPHFAISCRHSWCIWRFWWGWTGRVCASKWLWARFTCEELYCILLVLMAFYF